MRVLVIEDEQLAGDKLIGYIEEFITTNTQIEWVRSIAEAKAVFENNAGFDLIFSDIELLDGNVFQLYDAMEVGGCPIIFCTAYDDYVMRAFETNGIAYILKPYNETDFQDAWKKYNTLFRATGPSIPSTLLDELKTIVGTKRSEYKSRFTIKKSNGVFLLSVQDIVYVQAQGDFLMAYDSQAERHIINATLARIISQLDPAIFFQINRSEIINVNYIEKFETYFKNKLSVSMRGIEETLYTSSSRTPKFREWLG